MKALRQGAYMNNVRRIDDKLGISDAILLSTHFEGSASITFKLDTFEITDAKWAIHRATDPERRGQGRTEMLIGESAYVYGKNSIKILPDYSSWTDYNIPPGGWEGVQPNKSALAEPVTDREEAAARKNEVSEEWKIIRELYLENIRGIWQAEFYMLPERGYTSLMEYEEHWIGSKDGYCRPYNDGDRTVEEWPIYTGTPQHYRITDLYNKYKQFTIIDMEDGTVHANGTYNDSFHEFYVDVIYGKDDGIITKFEQNALRVPFPPCWELDHLHDDQFVGKDIRAFAKRDVGKIAGGSMGCFHLVDIVADIADMSKEI